MTTTTTPSDPHPHDNESTEAEDHEDVSDDDDDDDDDEEEEDVAGGADGTLLPVASDEEDVSTHSERSLVHSPNPAIATAWTVDAIAPEHSSTNANGEDVVDRKVDVDVDVDVDANANPKTNSPPPSSNSSSGGGGKVAVTEQDTSQSHNNNNNNNNCSSHTVAALRTILHTPNVPALVLPYRLQLHTNASTSTTASNNNTSSSNNSSGNGNHNGTAQDRAQAIAHARNLLLMEVPALPFVTMTQPTSNSTAANNNNSSSTTTATTGSTSHSPIAMDGTIACRVEEFGRVQAENSYRAKYSKPSAIYPVGFRCVRYEYSPMHGRAIALRCSIESGPIFVISWGDDVDQYHTNSTTSSSHTKAKVSSTTDDSSNEHIEEEEEEEVRNYGLRSFDPYPDVQPPAVYNPDAPLPTGSTTSEDMATTQLWDKMGNVIPPKINYAAKVRFDNDWWYAGYVSDVKPVTSTSVNSTNDVDTSHDKTCNNGQPQQLTQQQWLISITFDDGAVEEDIDYPSPDVLVFHPRTETQRHSSSNPNHHHKKHKVSSFASSSKKGKDKRYRNQVMVKGSTPLEAWAACLTHLGLIDEEIVQDAMMTLANVRELGLSEAKARYTAAREQRKAARAKKIAGNETSTTASAVDNGVGREGGDQNDGMTDDDLTEAANSEEEELLQTYNALLDTHSTLLSDAKDTSDTLCNIRASRNVAPFCSTPFSKSNSSASQQEQWFAAVIKREKGRMGHTGNKRKIVSSCDLLERLDTFYPCESVERLIEGLPGTDQCPAYVFKTCRGTGSHAASQAWVHEAQLRAEREISKEQNKSASAGKIKHSGKKEKATSIVDAQASKVERKRKLREIAIASKKQQKLDEEIVKRNERKLKRLRQLDVQVNERMLKEAMYQREKVARMLLKSQEREKAKRIKGVEGVVGYMVEKGLIKQDFTEKSMKQQNEVIDLVLPERFGEAFDRDVIRIWDFIQSYRLAFEEQEGTSLPSLEDLQSSITYLKNRDNNELANNKDVDSSIDTLVNLALILCRPLTTNLTKMLSLSVTAANVGYSYTPDYAIETLPVNIYTWREIARLALLADALVETGFSKVEAAHILRGYRSGGHPNTKEAKRLRRGEDFALLQLRQALVESANSSNVSKVGNELKVRVSVPCQPSCGPGDWQYYLHNIKALSSSDEGMGVNIKKALDLLKEREKLNDDVSKDDWQTFETDLERCIPMLKSKTDRSKARTISLRVLERFLKKTGIMSKPDSLVDSDVITAHSSATKEKLRKPSLKYKHTVTAMMTNQPEILTEKQYSKLVSIRENYMADAVKLKEAMERKKLRNEGEDVEDDDDDDDDDDDEDDVSQTSDDDASQNQDENEKKDEHDNVEKDPSRKEEKLDPFEEYCRDEPEAPDLIRRCLAVLRTISNSSGEAFVYPVDPQTSSRYYDAILRPICLMDVGNHLKESLQQKEVKVEDVVAQFAREIRLIVSNCICFSGVGAAIVTTAEEMLRVFERLLFDWVLCPEEWRTIDCLDDDTCVNPHPSDIACTVLVCDRCEGHYNMKRLDPPLAQIPQGDWYCPSCISGKCWAHIDPRIGTQVGKCFFEDAQIFYGTIKKVQHGVSRENRSTLLYTVIYDDGDEEIWSIDEVDESLAKQGKQVPSIRCLEAVSESMGYGNGKDYGLGESVPASLNPSISDAAAQIALTSSTFRDSISAITSLSRSLDHVTAEEWLKILSLLLVKCTSTDRVQEIATLLENAAAEKLANEISNAGEVNQLKNIVQSVMTDNEDETDDEVDSTEGNSGDILKSTATISNKTTRINHNVGNEDSSDDEQSWKDDAGESTQPEDTDMEMVESVEVTSEVADGDTEVVEAIDVEEIEDIDAKAEGAKTDVNTLPSDTLNKNLSLSPDLATGLIQPPQMTPEEIARIAFNAMMVQRDTLTKGREDCLLAQTLLNQMRPIVESFEEDTWTSAVHNVLLPRNEDISLSKCICENVLCDFCGLSDVALGVPIIRAPNVSEWNELLPHALSGRSTRLVADIGYRFPSGAAHLESLSDSNNQIPAPESKLVSVSVRVNGDLVSNMLPSNSRKVHGGGMLDFVLRNKAGVQDDLRFRDFTKLPFVSGSLSAHSCCAVVAHNARLNILQQKHNDKFAESAERKFSRECGRTLPLGQDPSGRHYWKFSADPTALFVSGRQSDRNKSWYRFKSPEVIASIVVGLGKHELVNELKRAFPKTVPLLRKRKWASKIQMKAYNFIHVENQESSLKEGDEYSNIPTKKNSPDIVDDMEVDIEGVENREPFVEGEEALVESKDGKLLWKASITAVSIDENSGKVDGYRIHYSDWSSRFDEWVQPLRVVEPSEYNIEVMDELYEESLTVKEGGGAPLDLHHMEAVKHLFAPRRARELRPPTYVDDLSNTSKKATSSDGKMLANLKIALLLIETSFPVKLVDNSPKGHWRQERSAGWRAKVKASTGPSALMECIIMLEDVLTRGQKTPALTMNGQHLLYCQPKFWKAVADATISSVATRIFLLDKAIKFAGPKEKGRKSR